VKPRGMIKGLLLMSALALAGFGLRLSGLDSFFNEAWVDSDIRGQGLAGEVLFFVVAAAFTSIGLPRQLVAFLGGYAFGLLAGVLISLAATVTGCITAFYFARLLGRKFVSARFPRRVQRIDEFLSDNPFTMTLLIRFLPLGSNFVTNLAAGVSSVRGLPFFAGSALGYIPQMVVFALVGSGVTLDPVFRTSLAAAIFIICGLLGIHLYRKYRHGKSLGADLDRDFEAEPLAKHDQ